MKLRHIIGIILFSLSINFLGIYLASSIAPYLFLDSVGTILSAILLGPWIGGLVGLLTNSIQGLVYTSVAIPFALVNCGIGIVSGYLALLLKGYHRWYAPLLIGSVAAILAPILAAPIATFLFGGITAHGTDKIITALIDSGNSALGSAFWGRIPASFADKLFAAYLAFFLIKQLCSFVPSLKSGKIDVTP
jgi:energy-coupling factor transport system substrate-specific component